MNFEDYNYDQFNRFILVDVNKPKISLQAYPTLNSKKSSVDLGQNDLGNLSALIPDDLALEDGAIEEMVGFSLPEGAKKGQDIEERKNPALTAKILDLSIKDDFSHKSLDTKTKKDIEEEETNKKFEMI